MSVTPTLTIPNVMTDGTVNSATPVNANFVAVAAAYNAIDVTTADGVDPSVFAENTFGTVASANTAKDNNLFQLLADNLINSMPAIQYIDANTIRIPANTSLIINGKARRIIADLDVVMAADLDTGAEAASTLYYIYAIADVSGATTFTVKFSTSAALPSPGGVGAVNYKKIGEVYNNASSVFERSSVTTYDSKVQTYELSKRYFNLGELPSIQYVSATTVRIPAGTIIKINNLKRRIGSDLDLDITAGTLDTGAEAASTLYYIYAVADGDGEFTGCFSINGTSPTGKTNYQLIGEVYNNAASDFVQCSVYTYDTHSQYIRGDRAGLRIETGTGTMALGANTATVSFAKAPTVGTDIIYFNFTPTSTAPGTGPTEYYFSYGIGAVAPFNITITANKNIVTGAMTFTWWALLAS